VLQCRPVSWALCNSWRVGRILIRTVWLGLILLVGLAALTSFKLALGSPRPVVVAEIEAVSSIQDATTVGTNAAPDTRTKGDRLQITYVSAVEPVAAAAPAPPETLRYRCTKDHQSPLA
jgi:hypothetical protein